MRRASRASWAGPSAHSAIVDVLAPLIVVVLLAVVVVVVSAPVRRRAAAVEDEREAVRRADLEAAKEAKYREIRDAELDYRTGKLSEADWRAIDRELRAEAMELLRAMDEV
jgi:flagellar biosynthesis/type III secretory pathway M-ring protein FliF/YscJ